MRTPRLRLLANEVYKIAHGDVDIDQVQAPVRQNLPVPTQIANDVAGAFSVRIGM